MVNFEYSILPGTGGGESHFSNASELAQFIRDLKLRNGQTLIIQVDMMAITPKDLKPIVATVKDRLKDFQITQSGLNLNIKKS